MKRTVCDSSGWQREEDDTWHPPATTPHYAQVLLHRQSSSGSETPPSSPPKRHCSPSLPRLPRADRDASPAAHDHWGKRNHPRHAHVVECLQSAVHKVMMVKAFRDSLKNEISEDSTRDVDALVFPDNVLTIGDRAAPPKGDVPDLPQALQRAVSETLVVDPDAIHVALEGLSVPNAVADDSPLSCTADMCMNAAAPEASGLQRHAFLDEMFDAFALGTGQIPATEQEQKLPFSMPLVLEEHAGIQEAPPNPPHDNSYIDAQVQALQSIDLSGPAAGSFNMVWQRCTTGAGWAMGTKLSFEEETNAPSRTGQQPPVPQAASVLCGPRLLAASALHPDQPPPPVPRTPRRAATMVDSNGNGRADLLLIDSTGDGKPDTPVRFVAVDTTNDGLTDALIADADGDGRGDCLVLDTTNDGIPDTAVPGVLVDTDGDGQANFFLVDTTGDGEADTVVHIWGTDSWRAPTDQHMCMFDPGNAPGSDETYLGTSALMGAAGADKKGGKKGGKKGDGFGKHGWTREEDETIVRMVQITGLKWSRIAAVLPGRTDDAVRNRYLRLQRKKAHQPGAPVTQDDLAECEAAKKGDMWTLEEDTAIMDGVARLGLKWQQIATALPGRSANAVRNRYLRCLPHGAVDALKQKSDVKFEYQGEDMLQPLMPTVVPTASSQPVGAACESGRGQQPTCTRLWDRRAGNSLSPLSSDCSLPQIQPPPIQPASGSGAFSFSSQASGALAVSDTGPSACTGCVGTTSGNLSLDDLCDQALESMDAEAWFLTNPLSEARVHVGSTESNVFAGVNFRETEPFPDEPEPGSPFQFC